MNNDEHISEERLQEIERFLQQQMLPAEEEFTARVSADENLKKDLGEMQLIFLGIQEASLEEKLGDFHKEISNGSQVPDRSQAQKKGTARLFSARTMLAAASIILLISISAWFIFFKPGKNEVLFTEYFRPDAGLMSAMSTSANYTFDRAMIDYKTGKYEDAIKTWDSLQHIQPNNDTLNYYLGSAWLAKSQTGKAIEYLQKVSASPNSFFAREADWYLGLAYLKDKKIKEAISFIERSDHPEKAALLSRLK